MAGHVQISTTVESREQADTLANSLVEKRLAACVQVIGPIRSHYRWEGAIQVSEEWLCTAKTRADCYDAVEQEIRALHTYDVPEIVAAPLSAASAPYLQWIDEEVRPS